jgi:hypothetical protein
MATKRHEEAQNESSYDFSCLFVASFCWSLFPRVRHPRFYQIVNVCKVPIFGHLDKRTDERGVPRGNPLGCIGLAICQIGGSTPRMSPGSAPMVSRTQVERIVENEGSIRDDQLASN